MTTKHKRKNLIGLLDLTERTCRYPLGDPGDDDFGFCGADSDIGKPYCEFHTQVASAGIPTRQRPNPNQPAKEEAHG